MASLFSGFQATDGFRPLFHVDHLRNVLTPLRTNASMRRRVRSVATRRSGRSVGAQARSIKTALVERLRINCRRSQGRTMAATIRAENEKRRRGQ